VLYIGDVSQRVRQQQRIAFLTTQSGGFFIQRQRRANMLEVALDLSLTFERED
jgi:hypothetical protein